MENEEMTNDAAVAWLVTNGGESCEPWLVWELSEVKALPSSCIADPLYSATTVAELRAEVAYYKENFLSCMATLNAINDAITEADEEGRGFVPVHQLTAALTKESP